MFYFRDCCCLSQGPKRYSGVKNCLTGGPTIMTMTMTLTTRRLD